MDTDSQQFENDEQTVDVAPFGKISADSHEWSCFLSFVFSLLSCFQSSRIVCFFPFS